MKILVTGGAGYIGSHTIHYLIERGVKRSDIIVFDNLSMGHSEFLPSGVKFIKGDLTSIAEIEKVFAENKINIVIHLAAYLNISESMMKPGKYFQNNLVGGMNLFETMAKYNCLKLIFSSTYATYGQTKTVPMLESSEQNPLNPYGESKLMLEKMIDWYGRIFGLKSIVFRYANAAGAGFGIGELHDPEPHLIPNVLFVAQGKNDGIDIYGDDYNTPDGTCQRDYIHVLDVADAHYRALDYFKNMDLNSEVFNLGTGQANSVLQIIKTAETVTKNKIKTYIKPRRLGDAGVLTINTVKANNILNWQAKYGIKKIISDAWQWNLKYTLTN